MLLLPVSVQQLGETVTSVLGDKVKNLKIALGELTITVAASDYLAVAVLLLFVAGHWLLADP